jgi:ribosomal peptide maturation radical SAM protein 1
MKTKRIKALLLSPPWGDYRCPSLQIGTLAGYSRMMRYDVTARHMHLEAASLYGLDDYSMIACMPPHVGEAIFASLLFPQRKDAILGVARGTVPNISHHASRMRRVLLEVYRSMNWSKYDLIGFTTSYAQLFASLLMARWLKRDHPQIGIVLGGASVSGEHGISIMEHFPQIDWCIDGEGEKALVSIIENLSESTIEDVPGLIYRANGEILKNKRCQIEDIDSLPEPDYDHFFQRLESSHKLKDRSIAKYIPIEVDRGCRYSCAFCDAHQMFSGYRSRSPNKIAMSIKKACKRYGVASYFLGSLMIDPKYCHKLFSRIASHKNDYKLYCEIRAGMPRKSLEMMKTAGVCNVQIGIEALDTRLLRKMNKGVRLIDNLETLKFCDEIGIKHNSNLLLGFPTENQGDIDRSVRAIDFAESLSPPCELSQFALHPESPVYLQPRRFSVTGIKDSGCFHGKLPRDLKEIKFWFKSFKGNGKRVNYAGLKRRLKLWHKKHSEAIASDRPLLYYLDFNDRLHIEDSRKILQTLTLDGWVRNLYTFCDSIRDWDEIVARFPDVDRKSLRKMLRSLLKLKVMFTEDDKWLSLAIHASPKDRHRMSFI